MGEQCDMGDTDLEHLVLSWSVQEITDGDLYGAKVETIPCNFKSLDHYFTAYRVPLIEETRSDLCSCLDLISEAPSSKILSMEVAGKPGLYLMDVDFWDNDAGFLTEAYSGRNGDIFILSSIKPEAAEDLNRHGVTCCLAMATKVSMDDEYQKGFRVKVSKNIGLKQEDLNKLKHAIFLNNITTNIRIWKALNFDARMNDNFTVIKSLLAPTNLGEDACRKCAKQDGGCLASYKEQLLSVKLNRSQVDAVTSVISAVRCGHVNLVKLIWGPPGTGKTKTVSALLWVLACLKCRTLTCAATNVAVIGVCTRFLKTLKDFNEHIDNICLPPSLGDILLLGSRSNMDITEDLQEVFLDFRVDELVECFSTSSGWNCKIASMISFFEDCASSYDMLLEDDGKIDPVCFLDFVKKQFDATAIALKRCIMNLRVHLPGSCFSRDSVINISSLLNMLEKFGTLLCDVDLTDEGLKRGLGCLSTENSVCAQHVSSIEKELNKARSSCLKLLKDLLHSLNLPTGVDKNWVQSYCLCNATLIFCTISSSYQLHHLDIAPLDVLIVDEAAQVRECELVIPLRLHWLKHVVLVGDDCQLSAMVKSKVCKEAGFETSLFGRLVMLKFDKHLLNIQYRMNPCISLFPNAQFYERTIVDGSNVLSPSSSKDYTCLPFGSYTFINVTGGREDKEGTGNSCRNMVEVAVVLHLIHTICKSWKRTDQGLSIGVISPYKAQVDAIKSRLGKKYDTCDGFHVRVKSIDGFQGEEDDIIILSTVRSNERGVVGFLADNRRTNVALTRARHCLLIVGNTHTLSKSGTEWTDLVADAERRKCVFSATNDVQVKDLLSHQNVATTVEQGKLEVPMAWYAKHDIKRYNKDYKVDVHEEHDLVDTSHAMVNSKVSESFILMKLSDIAKHLLTATDASKLDIPFRLTDAEQLFNSGSLFDGLSSEMERGNVLKATEWRVIKEDSNVEQLTSRADQEEVGKVKLKVDGVDGADLYWLADRKDEKDEKPPRIFVQDSWNSALVEAEARLRASGQTCVEDIPRFRINLNDICEKTYRKLMNQIDWWIKELSPLSLSGTPTTPPKVAGVESFYIVEIFEGEGEKMKTVQCLFRTYSLYFGAFCVQIGLNVIPPGWFIFDDEPLPEWIEGTQIPYSVAHGQIDNVELGDFWWPDIFNKFFNFPWNSKVWDSEISRAIKRGILILAEPKRFRTHQKMVVKTLKPGCTAKIKAEDDIHNWGKRSRESFDLNLNEDIQLSTESDDCYAKTLREKMLRRSVLYGPRGEILIFKYDEKYVVPIIMKLQAKAALQATRWKPEKDLLDKICGMLDDQFHHKSDAPFTRINLNEYRNLNDFNKYLVYILIHEEGTSVRKKLAAGIVLKNNMEVAYWKMPSSCRSYIKSQLSPCIGTCNKAIQSVVVKVIATLFQWVRVEGWMDLFQELYECLVSENFYQNEAAIALLLKISENCTAYLDVDILGLPERPINIFIPMLLKFLKSPKARLRKLSLSCVSQCMALMPSISCSDQFMDQYLDHLFQLFKDPSSNVRKQVCLSWVQLVELYPSSVEENLARMNVESWKDIEVAISSFGARTDNLGFIVLPLDDNFPLTRSTICRTILLCSKRIAQGLGHPSGREKFVGMMIALLWKMIDADGKVQETAFYALETLEKEMERKVGGETEARQAFHDHKQLHGVEGWQQLMSTLDPAVRQRLRRYEV